MTTYPMPVLDDAGQQTIADELRARGTSMVVGSVIDMGGVAHTKAVPLSRIGSFHRHGVGASPTWNVFCIDNAIALTERLGVVGDMRLRIDLSALTSLDDQLAWAPAEMFDQFGEPLPGCSRGLLRNMQSEAENHSLTALVGTEVEFTITDTDADPRGWQGYGTRAFLEYRDFLTALERALTDAALDPEQVHAEYGVNQFEVSFGPKTPLHAADTAVLARLLIGETARKFGLRVSFSPLPTVDGAGNGAHLHMSFAQNEQPLLAGGSGPHGLTKDGAAALAGIVTGLPDMLAVFAGSILSCHRLRPGLWSGAHACWGLENREAAVRLCAATPANPHGANIELKCVDTSANPYLAIAAMLGLAMHGIRDMTPLPDEVTRNPADLAPGTVAALAATHTETLDGFRDSALARALLGEAIVEATLAVRDHERITHGDLDLTRICDRFRYSWSL